ncbi:MAG TPA: type II secretion system protein [Candidatus Limnocylindrales bacterium]|nr:type II secretion system protein [Candidatus Limnocylindrales bacterium]
MIRATSNRRQARASTASAQAPAASGSPQAPPSGRAPAARKRPAPARRSRGFTLIELALTLLIASILFSLLLPRLPALTAAQLDASADRLSVLMTYLADESALRGRIYRLLLDLDRDSWEITSIRPYVTRKDEPPEFEEEWDAIAEDGVLPEGVRFETLITPEGEHISGRQPIYFLPEGAPQSVRVRVAEDDGGLREIEFDAASGAARVLTEQEMEAW